MKSKAVFTPPHIKFLDYNKDLAGPGKFPYTRGIYPTMYRGRLWTMRQYAGFGGAASTNKFFKYLLEQGQTGLSIAFDLPTQLGYDSDCKDVHGEVGKCGVAIDSLEDMEILLDGIPLNEISTSMTINAPAIVLFAMYIAIAKKQKVALNDLRGTVQNDILKEYMARGSYIFPVEESLRLTVDIVEYSSRFLKNWNPISISGYHIREAGSTAVQELALTFLNAQTYIEKILAKGLKIDDFAGGISFFFSAHNNFLEEIAKFRAARKIWAKLMRNKYKAKDKRSLLLRFHTQTAGSTLTAQQPLNNIARVTIQALSAVMGGTQSLHTNSFDEALWLPSQQAATVALRTQQIIAHESSLADTVDPLGGAYSIEYLTKQMEEDVQKYCDAIKKKGGTIKAIETGYIQNEIHQAAYKYQKDIERGKQIIAGVNKYKDKHQDDFFSSGFKIEPSIEKKQKERLRLLRKKRNENSIKTALKQLAGVAKTGENLMPSVINAVEAYVTVGEICEVLRQAFGKYKEHIYRG